MNLLFVCKYNRFRSKIAEAYFKKVNKNKRIKVKSAGLIKGNPISKRIFVTAKQNGIHITGKPQGLSSKLLQWQDITIVVAKEIPIEIFENKKYGKQLIAWRIPDAKNDDMKTAGKLISGIKKKVERLAIELQNAE